MTLTSDVAASVETGTLPSSATESKGLHTWEAIVVLETARTRQQPRMRCAQTQKHTFALG